MQTIKIGMELGKETFGRHLRRQADVKGEGDHKNQEEYPLFHGKLEQN